MACRPAGKFGELTRTISPTIDIGAETQNIGATWVDIDDTDDAASDQNLIAFCAQAATPRQDGRGKSGPVRWGSPPVGNGVPNRGIRRFGPDLKGD
jgi:hypothetical protein